jgi:phospholipid/cholesterol/gamma-HCH transport system permease protein
MKEAATGMTTEHHRVPPYTEQAAAHPVFNDGETTIHLTGQWHLEADTPEIKPVWTEVLTHKTDKIIIDTKHLKNWDSSILIFIISLINNCKKEKIIVSTDTLPDGIQQLLALASAVPAQRDAKTTKSPQSFLDSVSKEVLIFIQSTIEMVSFIGETAIAFGRLLRGKAKFRSFDFKLFLIETGAYALPIVLLISFLIGLILAFVGIMQLELFGAQIYVADLVGISMVRVMGAVMTGIIMAGRTGAAFAAQLGTMQVNEEIDALKTLAISPVEFLVIPRMLALTIMMPFLVIFANLAGIIGGAAIVCTFYDVNPILYFDRITTAVSMTDLFIGLFMGVVFGILISLSGCLRGIQCGRDASAVGRAATSAVVTSIVAIIIATAVIIISCAFLGI